jgi:hypothetical protein
MVNVVNEQPLTLQQLAERLPFSYKTIHSWSKYGHRGVKLETVPLGGKRISSMEAVQRFTERLAQLEAAPVPAVPPRSQDANRRLREEFGL